MVRVSLVRKRISFCSFKPFRWIKWNWICLRVEGRDYFLMGIRLAICIEAADGLPSWSFGINAAISYKGRTENLSLVNDVEHLYGALTYFYYDNAALVEGKVYGDFSVAQWWSGENNWLANYSLAEMCWKRRLSLTKMRSNRPTDWRLEDFSC